jgi:DNA-binding MarR family transcriptional regulator
MMTGPNKLPVFENSAGKTSESNGVSPAAIPADAPPQGDTENENAARVLRQFRVVFNAVKTHFRQTEKSVGIGGAQLWALSVVAAQPDLVVGELATTMDIHQSTASNLVKTLIDRQLVTTRKCGHDKRTVHLHITPSGRQFLERAPQPFAGVLPTALARLDTDTLNRLERDLGTLIDALDADPSAGQTPLGQI